MSDAEKAFTILAGLYDGASHDISDAADDGIDAAEELALADWYNEHLRFCSPSEIAATLAHRPDHATEGPAS